LTAPCPNGRSTRGGGRGRRRRCITHRRQVRCEPCLLHHFLGGGPVNTNPRATRIMIGDYARTNSSNACSSRAFNRTSIACSAASCAAARADGPGGSVMPCSAQLYGFPAHARTIRSFRRTKRRADRDVPWPT
jgi:hypothetical protein